MPDLKEYYSYPIILKSLFGLGLGIVLVSLIPTLAVVWIGLVLMLITVVLDAMTKKGS